MEPAGVCPEGVLVPFVTSQRINLQLHVLHKIRFLVIVKKKKIKRSMPQLSVTALYLKRFHRVFCNIFCKADHISQFRSVLA